VLSPLGFAGGLVAGLGGLLRVVAYMHWATDVLMGAMFGTLCGYCLPALLFDKRARTDLDEKQDVEGDPFSLQSSG
jgi:membrane-associated phospholipid phosphatase